MRLPVSILRARSAVAQALGLGLRAAAPLTLRLGRFLYETAARAKLRGRVAPGVQFVGPIIVEGLGKVYIGAGTRIGRRVFFETYGDARIDIGERVTINDGVVIVAYANITIGDYAMVGEYVSIRDADHGTLRGRPVREQPHVSEAVHIGRDAWLGRGVIVTRGVRVADGAVVGANSVVTANVEENVIVAGAPARPIGMRRAAADD